VTLPRDGDGFRLRGLQTTRVETFTDAAFAFALTLLVVSLDPPTTMEQMQNLFVHVPGFVISAMLLMIFWVGHNRWSRRYGLDDGRSVVLSFLLVCTVLVFVYPLRYMSSALASFTATMTGLPIGMDLGTLGISSARDVNIMFVIYGVGFACMSAVIALLNLHAWRRRDRLDLDEAERKGTRAEIGTWMILMCAGALSSLVASLFLDVYPVAGWVYAALGAVMPLYRRHAGAGGYESVVGEEAIITAK
jgi:uncharacterized membrane protein